MALTWDSRTLLIPSLLPVEETECSTVKIATKMTSWSVPQPKSSFEKEPSIASEIKVHPIPQPNKSISRLLLMSYFPSGFWSRLLTRILADVQIVNVLKDIYPMQVYLLLLTFQINRDLGNSMISFLFLCRMSTQMQRLHQSGNYGKLVSLCTMASS